MYTRFTEPRKKERVEEILKQVQIGPDLTEEERSKVQKFITEWVTSNMDDGQCGRCERKSTRELKGQGG